MSWVQPGALGTWGTMVFRVIVERSLRRVWKLCTGRPSAVFEQKPQFLDNAGGGHLVRFTRVRCLTLPSLRNVSRSGTQGGELRLRTVSMNMAI